MSKLIAKSEQPLEQRLAISRSMRVARRSWHLRIRIDTPPGAGAVPLVGEASGFFMVQAGCNCKLSLQLLVAMVHVFAQGRAFG